MKRLALLIAVALISTAAVVKAQVKVDDEGFKKKIAKSDTDIADAKKGVKATTWLDRGKLFKEVYDAPTIGLYGGMEEKAATIMFGKSNNSQQKIGSVDYKKMVYPNFTAYATNNAIVCWIPTYPLADNALAKSFEAYNKAYEMDKATAPKVKEGMNAIANAYRQEAANLYTLEKYPEAAAAFRLAYDAGMNPALNLIDTSSVFNAGYLYTVGLDFQKGVDNLKKAMEYDYENGGDLYYLMYHCYFGLKDNDNAKDILTKGLARFPKNNKIVEGLLAVYTSGGGDPKEIIPIVEKAISDDPKNPELYGGLGRIYDKLGEPDKSIEAFAKAAELSPTDFGSHFNLGLLYIKKGDTMNAELSKKVFPSQAEYNAALEGVNAPYSQAIIPLEFALSLKPNDPVTVELLKNVCFRLRDEVGIGEKYTKYKAMFDALPKE